MSIYRQKGSTVYTMDFQFQGQRIKESTGVRTKERARMVERNRRLALEEGRAGLSRPKPAQNFTASAEEYVATRLDSIAPGEKRGARRTLQIDQNNLKHLLPFFGKSLLCDISPRDVARYQQMRYAERASPATIKNELGTFRSVTTRSGHWARLLPDVQMPEIDNDDVGRGLSPVEVEAMLEACRLSESRLLYPVVFLLLETGSRSGTVLSLPWGEIDFEGRGLRWGRDKTKAGSRRTIPISQRALDMLGVWKENFPNRQPSHFVFPRERYKQPKDSERGTKSPFITDPTHHVTSLARSWDTARERTAWILAGRPDLGAATVGAAIEQGTIPPFHCRFHDLRHTAATRMMSAKVPIPIIAQLVGWSPTTMWAMSARYAHFSLEELREAVEGASIRRESPVNPHLFTTRSFAQPM